jgi:hypothetical protein
MKTTINVENVINQADAIKVKIGNDNVEYKEIRNL